jgi:hypothetical protein
MYLAMAASHTCCRWRPDGMRLSEPHSRQRFLNRFGAKHRVGSRAGDRSRSSFATPRGAANDNKTPKAAPPLVRAGCAVVQASNTRCTAYALNRAKLAPAQRSHCCVANNSFPAVIRTTSPTRASSMGSKVSTPPEGGSLDATALDHVSGRIRLVGTYGASMTNRVSEA